MERRDFLKAGGAACAGLAAGAAVLSPTVLAGTLARPGMKFGHALRTGRVGHTGAASRVPERVPVLIVGRGVGGFRRLLSRRPECTSMLLEMEDGIGGNAAWGESKVTRYPGGALPPLPSASPDT
jgi:hypothetical protein